MLDDQEWQQTGAPDGNLIQAVKDYQKRHGVTLGIATEEAPREILARYKDMIGFEETPEGYRPRICIADSNVRTVSSPPSKPRNISPGLA